MSIPNPHPPLLSEPPEGFEVEWYPDPKVRRVSFAEQQERACRGARRCPGVVVMALQRSNRGRPQWWFYCAAHTYGRRLIGGVWHGYRWKRVEGCS